MGKFLLTDGYVSINGVDLSDHAFSLDTPSEREQVDVSGFSAAGTREYLAGTREETITIGFLQDFGTGEVHQTLYPLYRDNTAFALEIRPTSSAVSSTNPRLAGTGKLFSYNGLSGELNARSEISAIIRSTDTAGITWQNS